MTESTQLDLKEYIRNIPDFPKPGIMFRDITPLLASSVAFAESIQRFVDRFENEKIDVIVAAEARGFIFAAPLAVRLEAGFVPIRKPGKLPFDTHALNYALEYGEDSLEMHVDGISNGQNVLVVDDLLATGGTIEACCRLVEKNGANVVGCAFLIELAALGGREKIAPRDIFRVMEY